MTATVSEQTYPSVLLSPGLTAAAVTAVGEFCDNPAWLRDNRAAAWRSFESIPMPTNRDEHWRFTSIRRFTLDNVLPFSGSDSSDDAITRADAAIIAGEETSARFVAVNNPIVETITNDLPEGVIVCELGEAAERYPELVQKHFGSAVPVTDSVNDKFVALTSSLWSSGVFVYVPRGVVVDKPIEYVIAHSVDGATLLPRVLIVLEEQAEVQFVEQYVSTSNDIAGFSSAIVEMVVGQGARLAYTTVQEYSPKVVHFATHRVLAARDAQVEWNAAGLGSERGKVRMEARLMGAGSSVRLNGVYFTDGRQHLDFDTQQFHEAPNAFSDLSFRGALAGSSSTVWRGMIDVAEGAQGTDSYQENRNLLLTKSAHADSIPGLQIEANEVRCTHGSTTSKVDADQLFYLQARGITRDDAVRMIVRGFFTPTLERMTNEALRERVRELLFSYIEAGQ